MSLPGNLKVLARDIVEGFFVFGPAACRQCLPEELRALHRHLEQLGRGIRAEVVPLERIAEVQRRNLRLGRANAALLLIRSHAKRLRVAL